MSLLTEIQEAAIDSSADILTVLRKCRVLASRLNHAELKAWVQHELDGYPADAILPGYRIIGTESKGHFIGGYGREMRNAPIPSGMFGEKVRAMLVKAEMRDSVSSLADLLRSDSGVFREEWPADILPHFHGKIYEGMGLAQAWKQIPRGAIVGIIETIRSRVLNFALEIEATNAEAGDVKPGSHPIPEQKVTQIFKTYITGNVGNISSGGSQFHQSATVQVGAGNARQLQQAVTALGLSNDDVSELEKAIQNDPPLEAQKPFGRRVSAWMGKAVGKAAQGLLKVSTEVAAEALSRTIKDYCGVPPSV